MSSFFEMQPEQFEKSPFQMIGKDWMLVTAEKDGHINAMTASWGGMGVMWGKDVAFVVIRPQRYTKEFVDQSDVFSLAFLGDAYRQTLNYFGTVSGRDEDKLHKSGLKIARMGQTPFIDEAETVLLCRKLYAQELRPECFLDRKLVDKWYPGEDFHTLYVSEIEHILVRA